MPWEPSAETKRAKRKNKLLMALICGPVFTLVLGAVMFLLSLLPERILDSSHYALWPAASGGCASAAAVADRLGKRFGLTPQEFAGPVAFSCVVFPLCLYALVWIWIAR